MCLGMILVPISKEIYLANITEKHDFVDRLSAVICALFISALVHISQ